MPPCSATDNAGVMPDNVDSALAIQDLSPPEPALLPNGDAAVAPPRRRDMLDLVLACFDRIGALLLPLGILALGAGLAYLGAICVTTALLRRSAAAQELFVNVLAEMQWSGYTILLMIGGGIALFSLVQLAFWPRGWLWRWLAHRLGRPVAWAATVLWATTIAVEALLVGWGFELWALPPYVEARAALGLTPTLDGLLLLSALVAPMIALLPEWCARFGFARLFRVLRSPPAGDQDAARNA